MTLAAPVKAQLVNVMPSAEVKARDGVVFVNVSAPLAQEKDLAQEIAEVAKKEAGVREIKVNVTPLTLSDHAPQFCWTPLVGRVTCGACMHVGRNSTTR